MVVASDAFMFDGRFFRSLPWKPPLIIGWAGEYIPDNLDWRGYDIILSNFSDSRRQALNLGALETEFFYPGFVEWLAGDSRKEILHDVVFVGQWSALHEKRNKFLQTLAREATKPGGFSLGLYLMGDRRRMPEEVLACCHPPCFGLAMHKALQGGKIAVNAGILPEAGNMRLFETTGSGVFLLTGREEGLENYFQPGVEVETYSDAEEAVEKIYYYLEHDKERDAIAQRGQERCWRDHSIAAQVEKLDNIIKRHVTDRVVPDLSRSADKFTRLRAQDDLSDVLAVAQKCRFGRWQVAYRGLTIFCHDLLSFYMAAKDIFIYGIYTFKSKSSEPIVIDGGSHIGLFSLMVKQLYPKARITAFEPDPESLGLLRKNIEINGFYDIEVIAAGLFDRDGEMAFTSDHSDGSSIFVGEGGAGSIKVTGLRPYLQNGVDFLKLNIEGAELEVLKDSADLLPKINEMVIEYHGFPEVGQRLHTILSILDRAGFRYLLHDFDKLTNPQTKPPFSLNERSRFFLLIYGIRLFKPKQPGEFGTENDSFAVRPVSRQFGFDRGTPVDRYYIDVFMRANDSFIHGHVLEIADKNYTSKFGKNIDSITVLGVTPGKGITLVGNLASGVNISQEKYDCILLTQTLQMIYDFGSALKHAYKALKPGGSILLTASGISQISRYDMERWGEYWRFTNKSMETLIGTLRPEADFAVQTYGNVAVAKAFLDGLAFEDLPAGVADFHDPDYQLLVTARITKPDGARRTSVSGGGERSGMVLIYHRVAEDVLDRNLLTVSPANFEAHLQILKRDFPVLPLVEMLKAVQSGSLMPGSIALTFDDGYVDNLVKALPLLEKYGIPATVFVTSGMLGSRKEFWWDALERLFLRADGLLPDRIVFCDNAGNEKGWPTVTLAERLQAHDEIAAFLRNSPVSEIDVFIDKLYDWAGGGVPPRPLHRVLDEQQLRALSASPLIEIGAHTVSHSRLSVLSEAEQFQEILRSKESLERILEKPIRVFSYPYGGQGDFTEGTKDLVKKAGFEFGIANIQKDLGLTFDGFAVPRRLVRNWDKEVFIGWLTGNARDRDRIELNSRRQKQEELLNPRNSC